MDEETTTSVPEEQAGQSIQGVAIDDQGMAIPQADEPQEPAPAEPDTTEPEEQEPPAPSEPEAEPQDSDTEQLAKWAENKGLTLDSDNATKAAKMAMNAEKLMHRKSGQASQLEKTLTGVSDETVEEVAQYQGQDPDVLRRVQRMEIKSNVRDFYDSHPDAKDLEPAMITELQKRPHLAGDLEALYAVVKTSNLSAVKSQGKREALESLAQKQQAAVPRGNAVTGSTNSNKITAQNVDQMVATHDQAWFRANYDAINRAMAG